MLQKGFDGAPNDRLAANLAILLRPAALPGAFATAGGHDDDRNAAIRC